MILPRYDTGLACPDCGRLLMRLDPPVGFPARFIDFPVPYSDIIERVIEEGTRTAPAKVERVAVLSYHCEACNRDFTAHDNRILPYHGDPPEFATYTPDESGTVRTVSDSLKQRVVSV